MLKSQMQLSQYDRYQTQRPKEFKKCRPFQMYQSALGFPRFLGFPRENRGKPSADWYIWNGLHFLNSFGPCPRQEWLSGMSVSRWDVVCSIWRTKVLSRWRTSISQKKKLSVKGMRGKGWQCSSMCCNMFSLRWDENGQVSSFSSAGPNLHMLNTLT